MPWKNGGGVTLEIATDPVEADLDSFLWRLSLAHVSRDGPFSRFAGVDRTLTVLSGEGMDLFMPGTETQRLTRDSPPFAFSGDFAVDAALIDGRIEDFNVMSRRGRASHRVERRLISGTTAIACSTSVAFALALAPVTLQGYSCQPFDGCLDTRDGFRILEAEAAEPAEVLLVQISITAAI